MTKEFRYDPAAPGLAMGEAMTKQRSQLRQLWRQFWRAADAVPRDQTKLNRLRAQMPPGGLSWPFWEAIGCRQPHLSEVDSSVAI